MEKIIQSHLNQIKDGSQRVGTYYVPEQGTKVRLWAPFAKEAKIERCDLGHFPLKREGDYFCGFFPDMKPGDDYYFHLDDKGRFPDPASRSQQKGTSGPSQVLEEAYSWTDQDWRGIPFKEWVIYEIHTGTFSKQHNFNGIIEDLPRLKKIGITTLEIMPVSPFPGKRNWGYDGVFPHGVENSYGGPKELKRLVNACHAHGMSIILDVVFNHIGPERNVLPGFAPYQIDKYQTAWGSTINFDDYNSEGVRRFFLQAAWQWLTEYHFDGLRLDAIHMIYDQSPVTFLQELSALALEAGKMRGFELPLIGEYDTNNSQLLRPLSHGGTGLTGQWADDLHHSLHSILTNETSGYYSDYTKGIEDLVYIYKNGVLYDGNYSERKKRFFGSSYNGIEKKRLVVATQNHDQVGNRPHGERLISLTGERKAKFAAACIFLSPFLPLVFMGEEFGCTQPFYYFVDYHDEELKEAVKKGRKEEWKDFSQPDDLPHFDEAFDLSVLKDKTSNYEMQEYYSELIKISKTIRQYNEPIVDFDKDKSHIYLIYKKQYEELKVILSLNDAATMYEGHELDPWSASISTNSSFSRVL